MINSYMNTMKRYDQSIDTSLLKTCYFLGKVGSLRIKSYDPCSLGKMIIEYLHIQYYAGKQQVLALFPWHVTEKIS